MGRSDVVVMPPGGLQLESGAASNSSNATALELTHIAKSFGATKALDHVGFAIQSGQIHGLVGGNGSGKSTLIKILAGVYEADGGELRIGDREVHAAAMTPELARELGFRFVHQDPGVFEEMTVAENMAMGPGYPSTFGKVRWGVLRQQTRQLLDAFGIDASPDSVLGDLRPAVRTMIAIARALHDQVLGEEEVGPNPILVLDEPTASLPEHEAVFLLKAVTEYARRGQTIVYVSHRLDEILQVTDAVTVLRDGRHVSTQDTSGMSEEQLVKLIVGRPVDGVFGVHRSTVSSSEALVVKGLSGGPLTGVDLHVRQGEILGIGGLLGSGRTELLRMLFGADGSDAELIELFGRRVVPRSISQMIALGVGYVPEDRAQDAAFMDMSVRDNLSAVDLGAFSKAGYISRGRERKAATDSIDRFRIKTDGDRINMSTLSGGNMQKVVVARWLRAKPKLLLLDEPTQGVDVGARADLYESIRANVAEGMAAILVASDFEELADVSDRVNILSGGRIVADLDASEINRGELAELAYKNWKVAA